MVLLISFHAMAAQSCTAYLREDTMAEPTKGVRMRRIGIALLLVSAGLGQNVSRMDQVVQSYVSDKKFMG
jgi:hypothetical protein